MVTVTPNIRSLWPAAFRKARLEKIRVVRLEANLYFVKRVADGHGKYLVTFFELPGINETTVKVQCRSVVGPACRGAFGDRLCVHAASAIQRAIRHGRKRERRAA